MKCNYILCAVFAAYVYCDYLFKNDDDKIVNVINTHHRHNRCPDCHKKFVKNAFKHEYKKNYKRCF